MVMYYVVAQTEAPPPIVVHCSAGVGRTGTFCAIDAVLDMLVHAATRGAEAADGDACDDAPGQDIVLETVKAIRRQRMCSVETRASLTGTGGRFVFNMTWSSDARINSSFAMMLSCWHKVAKGKTRHVHVSFLIKNDTGARGDHAPCIHPIVIIIGGGVKHGVPRQAPL